ncbi:hypothetical protein [Streptacidiphilus neutrinimicus]|uniref:hypothetical protein n=1 Tax=Streptacidiphilus neutrinimicus TaxID=105420 RepID=UPI0005AB87D4|nr:hypothetical protein [Streptacidiphilus neutrinimicus]
MGFWVLWMLLWVAFVARTYTVARRRWNGAPEAALRTPASWSERQRRSQLRTVVPMTVALDSSFGLVVLTAGYDHLHGAPATLLALVVLLFFLVAVVAAVLTGIVWRFNRPRALVPPALRDDLGSVGDFLARWRGRRNGSGYQG